MRFCSDNCGPVHPRAMKALAMANEAHAISYGDDVLTRKVADRLREIFEASGASVQFVGTGSAANCLILSTLCQPWHTVYCGALSHIRDNECNAVEFFGSGLKLCPLPVPEGKVRPADLEAAIHAQGAGDVHRPQPGALSITQVTECGTLYTLDEIRALTDVARAHGLATHMDGARFANAVAALGCTPAEMSWRSGIDAVSFGGTKNGLMGVEACIVFDADCDWELALRRKRGAHLFSKHRYLSAQMDAALTDGLWLTMARRANAAGQELAEGLRNLDGVGFDYEPQANMLFVRLPAGMSERLVRAGMIGSPGIGADESLRLVCDWSVTKDDVERFLAAARG